MRRALAVTIILSTALRAQAADWPQWRGPHRAGVWEGARLPAKLTQDDVEPRWRRPLGGGYSGIAVAGGRVYTLERAGGEERVVCLDAGTGSPIWTRAYAADYGDMDYANGPRSTPTVAGGRVFTQGAAGHIHALDADSGKVLWSLDVLARHGGKLPEWGHAASPLLAEGLVIVQGCGKPGPTVLALDAATGAVRWRALDEQPGYSSPTVIEAGGRRQVAFWSAESAVGLDPRSGEVLWRVPYKSTYGVAIISPVYEAGVLLVSGYWEGSKAFALEDGTKPVMRWEGKSLSCLMSTPLWSDGHLYALDKARGLVCVEWGSGKVLWDDGHAATPRARNPQASMVWCGDARAVLLNELGELVLSRLTPKGYEDLGRIPVIGKTWAHPAFAGQDVYARSDTEIACVRIRA